MSTKLLHSPQRRLREAAILVASLDDQLAERLVDSMPTAEAAAVRAAVKQLEDIDPDERDEIVAKFRQSTEVQRPTQVDGVELDASLLARFEEQDPHDDSHDVVSADFAAGALLETLNAEEATTIVSMLSAEHPQTISIVLSRLNPANAANLLSKFPPTLQADILTRMANCDSADEQAVRVIESQLGQWIDQHRQQRQRMADGLELVESILASTPDTQRKSVLTLLKGRNPDLAGRLDNKSTPTHNPSKSSSPRIKSETSGLLGRGSTVGNAVRPVEDVFNVGQTLESDFRQQKTPAAAPPTSAHPAEDLDRLDDATLIAALSQTDRQVVTLALAGASEALMKRVLRGLPRRQAGKLRKQLRDIGPTRLSDMLAAQQQLLHSAHRLTNNN